MSLVPSSNVKAGLAMFILMGLVGCSGAESDSQAKTEPDVKTLEAGSAAASGQEQEAKQWEAVVDSSTEAEKAKQEKGVISPYKTRQVAEHTYVIHGPTQMPNKQNKGFINNPGFIVTENAVVVVDPGSSTQIGRELVARIKQVTAKPITHVFASHIHGDHWLANDGIKEAFPEAKFYAHPTMIEKANAGDAQQWVNMMNNLTDDATSDTEAVIPAQALTHLQDVKVDGITIRAHIGEKAHTVTDVMYEVVEDKVLFTGDNITYKRIPRMDDGSFRGNISAADYGLNLPVEVVVPGHGPTGSKAVIKSYRDYLSTVYESSKSMMEEGMDSFEMKPTIMERLANYRDWAGLEGQLGKHISLSVLEAEEADF